MKHPKKNYRISMVIDGKERVLTEAWLKEIPVNRKHNSALANLMEGIKIGVVFSNEKYKSLEFKYEEVK